jgi:small conductance mechanosensitive channel
MELGDRLLEMGVQFGPKVLAAVVILGAGWAAGGWTARASRRALVKLQLDPPVRSLLERGIRLAVLAVFAVMALQNLGIELLPLIAGVGIAGAGVALALQGVLGNLFAGLTILITRPFRVGDYISIVNEEGEVVDITLTSTILGHADLSRVVIPNRKVVGEILHNYGKLRQLAVEIGIAYHADVDKALAAAEQVLLANSRVLRDPAPRLGVAKLGDSSVVLVLRPWVAVSDYGPATSEINREILATFHGLGISIPFPQREVRVLPAAAEVPAGLRARA